MPLNFYHNNKCSALLLKYPQAVENKLEWKINCLPDVSNILQHLRSFSGQTNLGHTSVQIS